MTTRLHRFSRDRRIPETSELREKAREEIKRLADQYSGLLGDADSLSESVKSVVWFIKKMTEAKEEGK
ncbi:MAG: hypothetical protein IMF19_01290 [Proteobacteria bacterium]|nr:hypothetical protein [Pseudomonadota bacterium]